MAAVPTSPRWNEISERWDAERLELVLSTARLGDWSWDAATDAVSFSPRAAEILELPAGVEMSRAQMQTILHRDDQEPARLAVERAVANHDAYRIEYRLVNGERERWVVASGRARYDDAGAVQGMYGVVMDTTRDRVLVRVDDVLRPLVRADEITFAAARELGQHLDVNRCAYAFVDEDEDTFTLTGNYTRGVESIVGRYRFRQFSAECLSAMRAGQPWVVNDSETDARIDTDDREAYRFTAIRGVICVPILKSGRFVAAMAVHTGAPRAWTTDDVELTQQVASRCWESIERARIEGERERLLEAAEAANRTKDEFLAMLGHELRNPLAPITTALDLMKHRAPGVLERERTVIERQVTHLTRLVDDLLDVSRIARGMVRLTREHVEISAVIARAVEVSSPLLERGAHNLTVSAPTGLVVDVDIERMVQVVSNLLSNACKFTPPGGDISIMAAAEGRDVMLRVRDTGVGMSAAALPQIFEMFTQATQTLDRSRGGLGLGLAIVQSLVERQGGRVTAFSAGLGKGSELTVCLPRAMNAASEARDAALGPEAGSLSSASNGLRVLVVDDNVDAAEMLAEVLQLRGCEVFTAHDGPEGLRLADTIRFDVALLDIGLPVMDGYELASRLRDMGHGAPTRLIAVTGYGQDDDRRRALAAGFHHHVVKPVDIGRLEQLVLRPPPVTEAAER